MLEPNAVSWFGLFEGDRVFLLLFLGVFNLHDVFVLRWFCEALKYQLPSLGQVMGVDCFCGFFSVLVSLKGKGHKTGYADQIAGVAIIVYMLPIFRASYEFHRTLIGLVTRPSSNLSFSKPQLMLASATSVRNQPRSV